MQVSWFTIRFPSLSIYVPSVSSRFPVAYVIRPHVISTSRWTNSKTLGCRTNALHTNVTWSYCKVFVVTMICDRFWVYQRNSLGWKQRYTIFRTVSMHLNNVKLISYLTGFPVKIQIQCRTLCQTSHKSIKSFKRSQNFMKKRIYIFIYVDKGVRGVKCKKTAIKNFHTTIAISQYKSVLSSTSPVSWWMYEGMCINCNMFKHLTRVTVKCKQAFNNLPMI